MVRVLAVLILGVAILPAAPTAAAPRFPAGARFDYQISNGYKPAAGVKIVDRDRHEKPAAGRYNICYMNAFQTQPEELRWWKKHHPNLLLRDAAGRYVVDEEWHENLLDISTKGKRAALAKIAGRWIRGCARAGFDAVEPDNLDSWSRSESLLKPRHSVAFAALLSKAAHANGMLIAQKNAAELAGRRSRMGTDFAIAEECEVYRECAAYTRAYGRRVIEIEYTDNGRKAFRRACAKRGDRISVEYIDREVAPRGDSAHVRRWCR